MQTIIIDGKTKYLKAVPFGFLTPINEMYFKDGKHYEVIDEPPYLFISYDGKEVNEGDVVYYVDESSLCNGKCTVNIDYPYDGYKYFTTEKSMQDYIIRNKPCLSLEDLLIVWTDESINIGMMFSSTSSPQFKRFETIAKSKIKF